MLSLHLFSMWFSFWSVSQLVCLCHTIQVALTNSDLTFFRKSSAKSTLSDWLSEGTQNFMPCPCQDIFEVPVIMQTT
jgi:hypothetical protein